MFMVYRASTLAPRCGLKTMASFRGVKSMVSSSLTTSTLRSERGVRTPATLPGNWV
ncbi:MAG: hypothetical protein ACOY31_11250 [Bacillota bacterium]